MPTIWRQNCKHGQLLWGYAIWLWLCQMEWIHSWNSRARASAASRAPSRVLSRVSDSARTVLIPTQGFVLNYQLLLNRCNVYWLLLFLLALSLQEAPTNIILHWHLRATLRDPCDARLLPGVVRAWAWLLLKVWLLNKIFTYLQRYSSN